MYKLPPSFVLYLQLIGILNLHLYNMSFIKYCEISILKLAPEPGIHNIGNKTDMSFSRINYCLDF